MPARQLYHQAKPSPQSPNLTTVIKAGTRWLTPVFSELRWQRQEDGGGSDANMVYTGHVGQYKFPGDSCVGLQYFEKDL